MVIKREVAYSIVRGVSEFWKSEELQDFTVTVGSTQMGCHRFLLAACSGFFRALFRSGMKETEQQSAVIDNISSATFSLILESMYTCHDILTNDNVIDMWHAANQLQIPFLIEECDIFVKRSLSLDNYEDYLFHAKLLNRENILEEIWNFVARNFDLFSSTKIFLELSVDKLLQLVNNQDLVVLNEDIVIKSIFKWVDHESTRVNDLHSNQKLRITQGDRSLRNNEALKQFNQVKTIESEEVDTNKSQFNEGLIEEKHSNDQKYTELSENHSPKNDEDQYGILTSGFSKSKVFVAETERLNEDLTNLLSAARICLCSVDVLEQALKHQMLTHNPKARDIILKALFYQFKKGLRSGQWPSAAIHRSFDQYENVGVTFYTDSNNKLTHLFALSFTEDEFFNIKEIPTKKSCFFPKCINIDNRLNIFSSCDTTLYRSILEIDSWETETYSFVEPNLTFTMENILIETVDQYVYMFKPGLHVFLKLDTSTNKILRIDLPFTKTSPVQLILAYDGHVLIFFTAADGTETVVQCFDTVKLTWTETNHLTGPAEMMTSVKNDTDTFILLTSGDLWRVVHTQSGVIDFEFVDELWTCDRPLHGAVTYMGHLVIFGNKPSADELSLKSSLPGIFKKITFMKSNSSGLLTFIPSVIPKKHINFVP